MTQRFRPHEHLRLASEFQRVYHRKRSVSDPVLIVYACENDRDYNRLGLSVSRKVGNAVARNRRRRLFREAFRLTKSTLPTGLDLILIPRSPVEPSLAEVMESLTRLIPQAARKLARELNPPS